MAATPIRPYPLREHQADEFIFNTELGNTYIIGFERFFWQSEIISMSVGEDINVYEVYFEVVDIQNKGYDRRIPFTIMNTIVDFLSVDDRIGYFFIQREDGRGKELLKVYNNWLKHYERIQGKAGLMVNRVVNISKFRQHYIACILHKSNRFLQEGNIDQLVDQVLTDLYPAGIEAEAF